MTARDLITEIVPQLTRNASVARIEERVDSYRVTIAGTTGVEAQCDVPRETADAALTRADARASLVSALKAAADATVAEVPDARG